MLYGTFPCPVRNRVLGIDQLDPLLWGLYPNLRYRGKDANLTDWIPWKYGQILTYHGSTNTPTFNNSSSPYIGPSDSAIDFTGTDLAATTPGCYRNDTGIILGDVATEDFVYELVVKNYTGGHGVLACKGWTASTYCIIPYWHSGNFMSCSMLSSTGTHDFQASSWGAASGFDHVFLTYKRGTAGGARWYRNGVLKNTGNALAGTFSAAGVFTVNATPTLQYSCIHWQMDYISLWYGAGMVPSSTATVDAMALARYNSLQGVF